MTAEQAWQIMNNISGVVRLTLEEHKSVQLALQILKPKVQPEAPKENEK